jgi:hypothetical protein
LDSAEYELAVALEAQKLQEAGQEMIPEYDVKSGQGLAAAAVDSAAPLEPLETGHLKVFAARTAAAGVAASGTAELRVASVGIAVGVVVAEGMTLAGTDHAAGVAVARQNLEVALEPLLAASLPPSCSEPS